MIVAVIAERSAAAARAVLEDLAARFPASAVLAELRLDLLEDPDPEVVRNAPVPVMATCRRPRDGGRFAGSEDARRGLLLAAAAAGAAWIDVESDVADAWISRIPARVLVSIHDFAGTPAGLGEIVRQAFARGVVRMKVVTRPAGLVDVLRLRRLVRDAPGEVTAFGVGAVGVLTRLLFRRMGSDWAYARAAGPDPVPGTVAEGLPAIDDLAGLYYPTADLPEPVAVYGVLSDRAGDSIGPVVFNRLFRQLGIPAIYVPITTRSLTGLREVMRAFEIRGLSVTTPFKEQVLAMADRVAERAGAAGAANTLTIEKGVFSADTTDGVGVVEPVLAALGAGAAVAGESALVLGVGGAGRAAASALRDAGFAVAVIGRRRARSEEVAKALGVAVAEPGAAPPRVLVHATPAGGPRDPEALPFAAHEGGVDLDRWLAADQVVLDMNYRVGETPIVARAQARGARTIPGSAMYAAQAWHQLRTFWDSAVVGPERMREVVSWAMTRRASS